MVKVERNDRVNLDVAVKLDVGVDVEVKRKVDDPSYAPELFVLRRSSAQSRSIHGGCASPVQRQRALRDPHP